MNKSEMLNKIGEYEDRKRVATMYRITKKASNVYVANDGIDDARITYMYEKIYAESIENNKSKGNWTEKIKIAKQVPIEKVIAAQGVEITGKGNVLTTKEHDSIKIFLKTNSYYRYSTNKGGTAIDYLINEKGYNKKDAIDYLAKMGGYIDQPRQNEAKKEEAKEKNYEEFKLPKKAENNRRVFAYLSSRGLKGDIIYDFIKKGLLYESEEKHNCVFVARDMSGNPKAGYMRGTYTYGDKQYKGNVPYSDKTYGIYVAGKSNEICCFEAPIDLMSFIQLIDTKANAHKIAFCGLDDTALGNVLAEHKEITKIILCLDNDAPGKEATETLSKKYIDAGYSVSKITPPIGKDWNDTLKDIAMNSSEKEIER